MNKQNQLEAMLWEMAHDPDIQREIACIEEEFSITLMDGLDDDAVGPCQDG